MLNLEALVFAATLGNEKQAYQERKGCECEVKLYRSELKWGYWIVPVGLPPSTIGMIPAWFKTKDLAIKSAVDYVGDDGLVVSIEEVSGGWRPDGWK